LEDGKGSTAAARKASSGSLSFSDDALSLCDDNPLCDGSHDDDGDVANVRGASPSSERAFSM